MGQEQALLEELNKIIENEDIRTLFQPIISLRDGEILGYEALSRGPKDSPLESAPSLFTTAIKADRMEELERICRDKSIDRFKLFDLNCKLFINVDPTMIYDFYNGNVKDIEISQGNIVIELTEKTHIRDFNKFGEALQRCKAKGYKVAIDDAGAGYSGLQSIVSISYNYIKLDLSLVRNVHEDMVKYSLLESMINFARKIGAKVIAEGIECKQELKTLIELGVDYGQGYLIARPNQEIVDRLEIVDYILEKKREFYRSRDYSQIGHLINEGVTVQINDKVSSVFDIFEEKRYLQSIVILSKKKPVALLTRNKFYSKMDTKYAYSTYVDKEVSSIIEDNALIVNEDETIEQVAQLAMRRNIEDIYDEVIVMRDNQYLGTASIRRLLDRLAQLQVEQARGVDSLTGLPGNLSIEKEVSIRLAKQELFSVLYIDLDHFKPYNNKYGYKKGDEVLAFTADLLKNTLVKLGNHDDFIGHIGGDDFIIITTPDKDELISKDIIRVFDKKIPKYFREEDITKGYLRVEDRDGNMQRYPLTSISISIINNHNNDIINYRQISDIALELKESAQKQEGSAFIKLNK
ncbi:GGDEF domain-containing protein [Orenia metallireducens]|nr:bifunctional diguanylate cyclase/phosphodiesterase [Orenia metallireducens]